MRALLSLVRRPPWTLGNANSNAEPNAEANRLVMNVNAFDGYSVSSLFYACSVGSAGAAQLLIDAKAQPDTGYLGHDCDYVTYCSDWSEDGHRSWTPMHVAAENGSAACVRALLHAKADANMNYVPDFPATHDECYFEAQPLHVAVDRGRFEVVKVLLRARVELDHKGTDSFWDDAVDFEKNMRTPLEIARLRLQQKQNTLSKLEARELELSQQGSSQLESSQLEKELQVNADVLARQKALAICRNNIRRARANCQWLEAAEARCKNRAQNEAQGQSRTRAMSALEKLWEAHASSDW
jgi:ankyrin repeat protein